MERERTKLMRASACWACLHTATVHDFEINVADIVAVANDLVGDVVAALDVVNLKRAARLKAVTDGAGRYSFAAATGETAWTSAFQGENHAAVSATPSSVSARFSANLLADFVVHVTEDFLHMTTRL